VSTGTARKRSALVLTVIGLDVEGFFGTGALRKAKVT
jgi:hypothetical protein